MYRVTKTYPHSLGLSACFRQHLAETHCRFLHGYPLAFTLVFRAETLDANNWVINFGGLKQVKAFLINAFDHRIVVAQNDPLLSEIVALQSLGLSQQALILENTGCEAFAKYVFDYVADWLLRQKVTNDVVLESVECREHSGNAASYGEK